MPCGWECDCTSGVALAMRHRLGGLFTYRLNGHRKGDVFYFTLHGAHRLGSHAI